MTDSELFSYAKQLQVPIDLLRETAKLGRLPVVNFAAGGLGNVLQKKHIMFGTQRQKKNIFK
jgi:pyridoxal biosynthesis lyase PdxS